MSGQDPTAGAAALAEQILEEVSSIDQDWGTISAWARELAALADAAAAAAAAGARREDEGA
jgi:hypothetical protein